jgi:hypothetical protein
MSQSEQAQIARNYGRLFDSVIIMSPMEEEQSTTQKYAHLYQTIKADRDTLIKALINNLIDFERQGIELPEVCKNCGAFADTDCGCHLGVFLCRNCPYDPRLEFEPGQGCDCPPQHYKITKDALVTAEILVSDLAHSVNTQ